MTVAFTLVRRSELDDLRAAAAAGEVDAQEAARLGVQVEELEQELKRVKGLLARESGMSRLLLDAVDGLWRASEAPVEIVVRDGAVHSVHRSRVDAERAVREAAPSAVAVPSGESTGCGRTVGCWVVDSHRLPELERPAHAAEIAEHFWPEGHVVSESTGAGAA
ncbi:hypothetical protein [Streptomyces sp. NPDC059142]|uniref:hypothetical protein n=1 Tax=Streptomyces sp. NPDC059142 TaxID=3346739 RepID=UPI00367C6E50